MNLLNDMKEIKKIELRLSNNSENKEKYIKIIGTYLMRNYQLSKINNKDLLSKSLFWWMYIYAYIWIYDYYIYYV